MGPTSFILSFETFREVQEPTYALKMQAGYCGHNVTSTRHREELLFLRPLKVIFPVFVGWLNSPTDEESIRPSLL